MAATIITVHQVGLSANDGHMINGMEASLTQVNGLQIPLENNNIDQVI